MNPRRTMPTAVLMGLILAIVLDTAIQILWKFAVRDLPPEAGFVATAAGALSNRYFYLAMAAFAAQLFNWTRVLARADLSFAQPFTALGYITVLTFSSHSLNEQITSTMILGVVFIFLGVFFISRTSHATIRPAVPPETLG